MANENFLALSLLLLDALVCADGCLTSRNLKKTQQKSEQSENADYFHLSSNEISERTINVNFNNHLCNYAGRFLVFLFILRIFRKKFFFFSVKKLNSLGHESVLSNKSLFKSGSLCAQYKLRSNMYNKMLFRVYI